MTNRDLKMLAEREAMRSLDDTMNAIVHDAVRKGTCVIIHDDKIAYAGPIKNAPMVPGSGVLLHADDAKALMKIAQTHPTAAKH